MDIIPDHLTADQIDWGDDSEFKPLTRQACLESINSFNDNDELTLKYDSMYRQPVLPRKRKWNDYADGETHSAGHAKWKCNYSYP